MDNGKHGRLTRDGIRIYETSDFAGMHRAGELAARIPDVDWTEELDRLAELEKQAVTITAPDKHQREPRRLPRHPG